MLQWKVAGTIMIIPTVTVALVICWKSWKEKGDEFWINLAICFWIAANSYWMLCEFSTHENIKDYAGFPFVAGMFCVAYFYFKRLLNKKEDSNIL
jgi:phosphatidylserine synthase